jgi:hypothetical protein
MTEFTALDKYQAVLREINYRRKVYPRLIDRGQLTASAAKREIEIMVAIGQDYEAQLPKDRPL